MRSVVIFSLAALAVAAPTRRDESKDYKQTTTQYEATFDDLNAPVGGLVDLQEVGPYDGLDYVGINVIKLGLGGTVIAGVRPESQDQVGVYTARNLLLNGDTPTITTQYPGSVTDTFDFQQFYFGCVVATAETAASVPISCTVKVQGYKASNEVAEQDFYFTPDNPIVSDLMLASLGSKFIGVDEVKFSTLYTDSDALSGVVGAAGATILDSLSYKTYNADAPKYVANGQDEEYKQDEKKENKSLLGLGLGSL